MSDKTWIQTSSGGAFDFLEPSPDSVGPRDIAAGLSKLCRYTGQCPYFYSVAQHCVYAWEYVVKQYGVARNHPLAQAALLHDASEAYCQDVSSPLKAAMRVISQRSPDAPPFNPYDRIENDVHDAIREAFKIPHEFWKAPHIKEADNRVYATERLALFPDETKRPWKPAAEPIDWLRIKRWWDPTLGETGAAHERYVWALQDAGLL